MDSFFLAEMFKYLYLMFSEKSHLSIDMDRYIFTTEAHLLPISLSTTQPPCPGNDTVRALTLSQTPVQNLPLFSIQACVYQPLCLVHLSNCFLTWISNQAITCQQLNSLKLRPQREVPIGNAFEADSWLLVDIPGSSCLRDPLNIFTTGYSYSCL